MTRYEIASEPLTLYACHCTHCQTTSGASLTPILVAPVDFIRPECLTALWASVPTPAVSPPSTPPRVQMWPTSSKDEE